MAKAKDHPSKIAHRHIRFDHGNGDGTTWPFPFDTTDNDSPAWKARYAPNRLTKSDLYELADIADAYRTMITHPCRSVRMTIHAIHRAWKRWAATVDANHADDRADAASL